MVPGIYTNYQLTPNFKWRLTLTYREKIITLRQNPCQSQLAGCATLLLRDFRDLVHKLQVLREVLCAEARCILAEVTILEVVRAANCATEHAAADG